jgi:tetratricopeptide (TPR) repeat protein
VHRYEELEKIYYKKMFLKIIVILLCLFVAFVGIYYFYKNGFHSYKSSQSVKIDKIENNQSKEKNKTKIQQKVAEKNKIKTFKKIENTNKTNQEEKLTFVIPQISENEIKKEIKFPKKIENPSNKKTKSETKIKKPLNTLVIVKPKIEIKKITVSELKQKFSQNPSYDIAIMIAKEYYKRKNYKQAQIWAVKANTLDPTRVESWILFADILLKESKKKKALEILKVYLDQYGEDERIKAKLRSINE